MISYSVDASTRSQDTGVYDACPSQRKSFLMKLHGKVENVKHKIRRTTPHASGSYDASDHASMRSGESGRWRFSPDHTTVSTLSRSPDVNRSTSPPEHSARCSRSASPLARRGNPPSEIQRFRFQSPMNAGMDDSTGLEHTEVQEQGGILFKDFQKKCNEDFEDSRLAFQLVCTCLTECELWSRQQDARATVSGSLSKFEGEQLPCSFEKYVLRILRYSESSPSCVIVGLILLLNVKKKEPELQLTETNAQRILLVAIMVANKFLDDEIYSNKMWAKIGELTLTELNKLELAFLCMIDMSCPVRREHYDDLILMLTFVNPFLDDAAEYPPPRSLHNARRSTMPKDQLTSPSSSPKRTLHSHHNKASSFEMKPDPTPVHQQPSPNRMSMSFDEIRKDTPAMPTKMTQFFRKASYRLGALLAH